MYENRLLKYKMSEKQQVLLSKDAFNNSSAYLALETGF